ncbi:LysE family translocator [Geomonas limicola]|uniref:LysE family translocator n=2 Tax=Geomonas limicola TaxID=2740186 RepID=A0A6V8N9C6_9BACT|nr:LysE family translocator [Geomonas limicola]
MVSKVITFLSAGALLGLSAGFSPGPLFALVLTQTLQHGIKEGCKVALAPLLTDLPLIVVATLLVQQLAGYQQLLGVVSILGALYLLFMALETFRCGLKEPSLEGAAPKSLGRGMLVNVLSPHPYLFWFSVGAPTILKGFNAGRPWAAVAFVLGFFGCLIGAKMTLALLVGKSRRFLAGQVYHYLMRGLALLLLVFALLLAREGLALFGLTLV